MVGDDTNHGEKMVGEGTNHGEKSFTQEVSCKDCKVATGRRVLPRCCSRCMKFHAELFHAKKHPVNESLVISDFIYLDPAGFSKPV